MAGTVHQLNSAGLILLYLLGKQDTQTEVLFASFFSVGVWSLSACYSVHLCSVVNLLVIWATCFELPVYLYCV